VKTLFDVNFSQATNNLFAQVSAAGLNPAALAAINQGNPTAGAAQLVPRQSIKVGLLARRASEG